MNLRNILIWAVCAIVPATQAIAVTPNAANLRNTVATTPETYKSALAKFVAGDTLRPEDMAIVYYGAALQPGFKAKASYPSVINAYNLGDFAKAYALAAKALESDPTNLELLFKAYACAASIADPKANMQAPKLQNRLLQICDLIFKSGMGVTDNSPYMVTRDSDINEFLTKYIQPSTISSRATIGDMQAVKANIEGVPEEVIFYFSQFK